MGEILEAMIHHRNIEAVKGKFLLFPEREFNFPKKGFFIYPQEGSATRNIRRQPKWKQVLNGPCLPEHFIEHMGYDNYKSCTDIKAHKLLISMFIYKDKTRNEEFYHTLKKGDIITKNLTHAQANFILTLYEQRNNPELIVPFISEIVSERMETTSI